MAFEPKTSVGESFRKRLEELSANSTANAQATLGRGPAKWYQPEGATKSFATADGNTEIHGLFTREQQEKWFDEVTKDRNNTGTFGDLAQIALQGDFLACMERAYRTRHQTAVQTRIYPSARLDGQGSDFGVIKQGMLGYATGIDKINKGEPEIKE